MIYRCLQDCVTDLDKTNQLIKIKTEVNADLEVAEIHRRIYDAKGPAILFEHIKGSPFRALSNLYGTNERVDYLFKDTLEIVKKLIEIKAQPDRFLKKPLYYWKTILTAWDAIPKLCRSKPASMYGTTSIDQLPLLRSWPLDGGGFITLPQVLSMPPDSNNILDSNLGMYRIQLSGNDYKLNEEIGLHYQIHRGIGIHHQLYNHSEKEFKVAIYVGGLPSHALSAIFPLPEALSELTFAGMLAGRKFRYYKYNGYIVSADADFVILGIVDKKLMKPEGPFGDHLGYYSLQHLFPYLKLEHIFHKKDPIWHFTVVGRPPQEDSGFGYLIHELVKELTPIEFPGIKQIHAVDVAGVHPLLLAIGSERYMPFRKKQPEEILTIANRLLGSGQTSLAKFVIIADGEDEPQLDTHNFSAFFQHVLSRIDFKRDLHFQTKTTIDTLDYSGTGLNEGSKLVIACCGPQIRMLSSQLSDSFRLTSPWKMVKHFDHGILCIEGIDFESYEKASTEIDLLNNQLAMLDLSGTALIVICNDVEFTTANWENFLWVSFTRSNPAKDIYGVGANIIYKHWQCEGPLILDSRIKPHHAPGLVPDKTTVEKVDKLFSKGGELYGILPKSF